MIIYDFKNTSLEKREYIEDVDDKMDVWLDIRPARGHHRNKVVLLIVTFEKYSTEAQAALPILSTASELFCENVLKCDIMDKNDQSYCSPNYHAKNILSIPLIIIIAHWCHVHN